MDPKNKRKKAFFIPRPWYSYHRNQTRQSLIRVTQHCELKEAVILAGLRLDATLSGPSGRLTPAKVPLFRPVTSHSLSVPREQLAGESVVLGLHEMITLIDTEQPWMAPAIKTRLENVSAPPVSPLSTLKFRTTRNFLTLTKDNPVHFVAPDCISNTSFACTLVDLNFIDSENLREREEGLGHCFCICNSSYSMKCISSVKISVASANLCSFTLLTAKTISWILSMIMDVTADFEASGLGAFLMLVLPRLNSFTQRNSRIVLYDNYFSCLSVRRVA